MYSSLSGLPAHRFSSSQELERNPLLLLAEVSISQLSGFKCPVQMPNPPYSGYLGRQANQYIPGRPLNGFSISHLSPTEGELALVGSLNKGIQQRVLTEAIKFKAPGSFALCEPVPDKLTESQVFEIDKAGKVKCTASDKARIRRAKIQARYSASERGRVNQLKCQAIYSTSPEGKLVRDGYYSSDKARETRARYKESGRDKMRRARYAASVKGKETIARYRKSVKGRLSQARYLASAKGKEARAKYQTSDAGRASKARYDASDKGKMTRARYKASDEGKAKLAIRNARSNAYRLGLRQGLSEELARKKGALAAENKRAALSSVLSLRGSTLNLL